MSRYGPGDEYYDFEQNAEVPDFDQPTDEQAYNQPVNMETQYDRERTEYFQQQEQDQQQREQGYHQQLAARASILDIETARQRTAALRWNIHYLENMPLPDQNTDPNSQVAYVRRHLLAELRSVADNAEGYYAYGTARTTQTAPDPLARTRWNNSGDAMFCASLTKLRHDPQALETLENAYQSLRNFYAVTGYETTIIDSLQGFFNTARQLIHTGWTEPLADGSEPQFVDLRASSALAVGAVLALQAHEVSDYTGAGYPTDPSGGATYNTRVDQDVDEHAAAPSQRQWLWRDGQLYLDERGSGDWQWYDYQSYLDSQPAVDEPLDRGHNEEPGGGWNGGNSYANE